MRTQPLILRVEDVADATDRRAHLMQNAIFDTRALVDEYLRLLHAAKRVVADVPILHHQGGEALLALAEVVTDQTENEKVTDG